MRTPERGRLSCSLANETDRDWLVCVDESGVIVPKSVPEDARPSDIVEWTEIETFPNDVRWIYRLAPKPTGLAVDPDPWVLSWQIDEPGDREDRLALPVRAIDWDRYCCSTGNTNGTPVEFGGKTELLWRLDVLGSNLVLTVENPSDTPVLLHVSSNDQNKRYREQWTGGPFMLSGTLRSPGPRIFLVQFGWVPVSPSSGLYRVLHGRSASPELRRQYFKLAPIPEEGWSPGETVSCSIEFRPRIVTPSSGTFHTHGVVKSKKISSEFVFQRDGWHLETVSNRIP